MSREWTRNREPACTHSPRDKAQIEDGEMKTRSLPETHKSLCVTCALIFSHTHRESFINQTSYSRGVYRNFLCAFCAVYTFILYYLHARYKMRYRSTKYIYFLDRINSVRVCDFIVLLLEWFIVLLHLNHCSTNHNAEKNFPSDKQVKE